MNGHAEIGDMIGKQGKYTNRLFIFSQNLPAN